MRDSREKGAGMRDQDPPFQTLSDLVSGYGENFFSAGVFLLGLTF